ncbi:MAG TPA: hypothetical protein VGO89_04715, partial [Streptomyces sp.]|nr:hypothetical protein [Streptomyces sp.]
MFVLALCTAACSGGAVDGKSSSKAEGKGSEQGAPARPVQVESKQQGITWTDLEKQSHELRAAPSKLARGSAADLKGVR